MPPGMSESQIAYQLFESLVNPSKAALKKKKDVVPRLKDAAPPRAKPPEAKVLPTPPFKDATFSVPLASRAASQKESSAKGGQVDSLMSSLDACKLTDVRESASCPVCGAAVASKASMCSDCIDISLQCSVCGGICDTNNLLCSTCEEITLMDFDSP